MSATAQSLLAAATAMVGTTGPLYELLSFLARQSGEGGGGGFQGVLFVAKNGDDATGARNTLRPFLTVQAAVTASQDGDVVIVSPGDYNEQVTLPAARRTLTIKGMAASVSRIVSEEGSGLAGILWSPSSELESRLTLIDLGLATDLQAVAITPAIANQGKCSLVLRQVEARSVTQVDVDLADMLEVLVDTFTGGEITVDNAIRGRFRNLVLDAELTFNVDVPTPIWLTDHENFVVESGQINQINHRGAAAVEVWEPVQVISQYLATPLLAGDGMFPQINFWGRAQSATIVTPADTETGTPINLIGARFSVLTIDNASAAPVEVFAQGVYVDQPAGLTGQASGGTDLILRLRSSNVQEIVLGAGNTGNVFAETDGGVIVNANLAPGANAFTFGAGPLAAFRPFPIGTDLDITPTPRAALATPFYVPAQDNASFTVQNPTGGAVAANISWRPRVLAWVFPLSENHNHVSTPR